MAVNSVFHTDNSTAITTEKNLYRDLVKEAIQIYGHDVYYMDRELVAEDTTFGEDSLSKFITQHPIEMYVEDGEGYAGDKEIMVVEEVSLASPKTKDFTHILNKLGIVGKKITFFPVTSNKNVVLSARNLPNVTVIEATTASTYDLLDAEVLLFEKEGLKKLNDLLTVN